MSSPLVNSKNAKLRNSDGSLAEFGPALILLCALLLAPAIVLFRISLAAEAAAYAATLAAEAAATTPTYSQALPNSKQAVINLTHSRLWKLSGLKPDALKQVILFVDEQVTSSGASILSPADRPPAKPIDAGVDTFEYEVQISYRLEPILPVNNFSFLGKIPLLTKAANLTACAVRPVEFPDGL